MQNPSRETKFSGANGDREILFFPVQLTTSRIGNLTRLIHNLLYVMTLHTSRCAGYLVDHSGDEGSGTVSEVLQYCINNTVYLRAMTEHPARYSRRGRISRVGQLNSS